MSNQLTKKKEKKKTHVTKTHEKGSKSIEDHLKTKEMINLLQQNKKTKSNALSSASSRSLTTHERNPTKKKKQQDNRVISENKTSSKPYSPPLPPPPLLMTAVSSSSKSRSDSDSQSHSSNSNSIHNVAPESKRKQKENPRKQHDTMLKKEPKKNSTKTNQRRTTLHNK